MDKIKTSTTFQIVQNKDEMFASTDLSAIDCEKIVGNVNEFKLAKKPAKLPGSTGLKAITNVKEENCIKKFLLNYQIKNPIFNNKPQLLFFSTLYIALARATYHNELVANYRDYQQSTLLNIKLDKELKIFDLILESLDNFSLHWQNYAENLHIKCIPDINNFKSDQICDLEFFYMLNLTKLDKTVNSLRVYVNKENKQPNEYNISILFNQSKFTIAQIEKIYQLWNSLLDIAQNKSSIKIKDICLISQQEINLVTNIFNQTATDYPKDKCMLDLLTEQTRLQPDNLAVVHENQSLTYAKMLELSTNLAIYLQYLGVHANSYVGLFTDPSIDLIVGAWGIVASGGAYLPISPEYPEERIKYMIEDSGVKIFFAQEELKAKLILLVSCNSIIISLNDAEQFKKTKIENKHLQLTAKVNPNSLAYIIYTSGSSGKPKGVMIEQHSIINQMYWLKNEFGLNNKIIILQKTPISFDAAQWEILSLAYGAKIIMGGPEIYKNPGKLLETILKYQVNTLQCVPTLLQSLIDSNEFHHCTCLKQIFIGGEALSKNLVLSCQKVLPNVNLINLYGPTECTINTSSFVIRPDTILDDDNMITIGKPINNTYYYILDNCQSPVPIGEIGELYIGGEGLARGYLNRADLTKERFMENTNNLVKNKPVTKLYRTGDLAYWKSDNTVQYAGRADTQIKLRGYRIELDEIKLAIEDHDWVKNAAVIVKNDEHSGYQNLIAFATLDPKEAAIMDQGNHDDHHQSKENKAQVMLQLANKGLREKSELNNKTAFALAGKLPGKKHKERVFARKTYRFFEGGAVTKNDILQLLKRKVKANHSNRVNLISQHTLGEILRYFGQFSSKDRLLPKYGYASPGALYATQMYLELDQIDNLPTGYYYYHPLYHQLVLIKERPAGKLAEIKVHFIGKKSAIEPIYKNNILEVLEIEAGHMVGLFEEILPEYGFSIKDCDYLSDNKRHFEVAEEDFYLGSFKIVEAAHEEKDDGVDIYVQVHANMIAGLEAGFYAYQNEQLNKTSAEIILKKHVVAINQEVYERCSFGIGIVSRTNKEWMKYLILGRKLQHLQMNNLNVGLMSSGYSSKTGNDLPSARRMQNILNKKIQAFYFCIGGKISDEQRQNTGMKEDAVHMRGPAEMIRDDLKSFLPYYMQPNKIIILDNMPLTVNSKIDVNQLKTYDIELTKREYIAPRNQIEDEIAKIWQYVLNQDNISVNDNFFELGGNSLLTISIINKIEEKLKCSLSLQVLFQAPTIEQLALKVKCEAFRSTSRLVLLKNGLGNPLFIWPGIGGYCMNLHLLANKLDNNRPIFGVQAYGINPDETPYKTIKEMAKTDIEMLKKVQAAGPYTLYGYSFGARLAFETAYQLEQAGEVIENLFLIAPGSPKINDYKTSNNTNEANYADRAYLTILFSVFMGTITHNLLEKCLNTVTNDDSFIDFITSENKELDKNLVRRIIKIVAIRYESKYSFTELAKRTLNTPITIFKATGDDYSFIENSDGFSVSEPKIINLAADHYSMLAEAGVNELATEIKRV